MTDCAPPPIPAKALAEAYGCHKRARVENDLRDAVRQYAELNGWLAYFTADSRRSPPGFPDLCMVRGLRMVFAELKRDHREKPTDAQEAWLEALRGVGGPVEVYVWRPSDWPEIEATLRRRERGTFAGSGATGVVTGQG